MRLPAWDAAHEEVRGHVRLAAGDAEGARAQFGLAEVGFAAAGHPLDARRCPPSPAPAERPPAGIGATEGRRYARPWLRTRPRTPSDPTPGWSTRCTSSTWPTPRRSASRWQDFFHDYRPRVTPQPAGVDGAHDRRPAGRRRRRPRPARRRRPPAETSRRPTHAPRPTSPASRSAASAPASSTNMEASLGVPPPPRFREVPAKLLEVNRKHHQRLPGSHPRRQGQLHPPHRLRRGAGHRRRRAGDERRLRRGPRRQAPRRAPRPRRPRPRRRRREARRLAHAAGARASRTPTPSTSGLLGAPTRSSSARSAPTSSPPTTSPAPPSPSPTPARSAPCSRCPGSCRARA